MEAQVRLGNLVLKVTGDSQKSLFEAVASATEVFGDEPCGHCQGTDHRFVVRTNQDNQFYERHCNNPQCKAYLTYGQHKGEDTLFPVRKIIREGKDAGKPHSQLGEPDYRHRGWVRWDGGKTTVHKALAGATSPPPTPPAQARRS